jgi:hypothetical protein
MSLELCNKKPLASKHHTERASAEGSIEMRSVGCLHWKYRDHPPKILSSVSYPFTPSYECYLFFFLYILLTSLPSLLAVINVLTLQVYLQCPKWNIEGGQRSTTHP